jgi:hypothetical protein
MFGAIVGLWRSHLQLTVLIIAPTLEHFAQEPLHSTELRRNNGNLYTYFKRNSRLRRCG